MFSPKGETQLKDKTTGKQTKVQIKETKTSLLRENTKTAANSGKPAIENKQTRETSRPIHQDTNRYETPRSLSTNNTTKTQTDHQLEQPVIYKQNLRPP
jgi:hypothetical protein